MSFKKSRKQQNRDFWRTIFIWTIGLSIPCYLFAFFVYAFVPRQADRIIPTAFVTATWTPIDPNLILTQRALTNPAPSDLPLFASNTPFDNFTAAPIFFTPDVFLSPTLLPTRFNTAIPSITPAITATTAPTLVQATIQATDAPPIIMPPTDTPNP